ncbi:MAG: hypothetical protein H0V70_04850 [Ktedonobacteraceae bacterium]|nr:hypothetical protein [Ktedonobacteraceae bacterium]
MRFALSLLNVFSQHNQDNAVPQDVLELTQDELDQVSGGHGKDSHHNHKNHHHHHHSQESCYNPCNNYYYSSSYNCYTY